MTSQAKCGPGRTVCRAVEILLVDDSGADIALMRRALKAVRPAIEVLAASSGEEALARLRREGRFADAATPALVLLDLNMPRLNGIEVLNAIKTDPALQSIPVVILTSSTEENDVARAYAAHANAYVKKPEDIDSLKAVIANLAGFWLSAVVLPGRSPTEPEQGHPENDLSGYAGTADANCRRR